MIIPELEQVSRPESQESIKAFRLSEGKFDPFFHYHPEIELTLIESGHGIRFIGDNIQSYKAGDLVLIGANVPHNWISENGKVLSIATVIQFKPEIIPQISEFYPLIQLMRNAERGIRFPGIPQNILDKIKQLPNAEPLNRFLMLMPILSYLSGLDDVESLSTNKVLLKKEAKSSVRLEKITTYILEHFDRNITLQEVADLTGLTIPSFCRWFKSHFEMRFVEYLNRIRIEKASELIAYSNYSISVIAFNCGFESLTTFNRNFKKYKGHQPKHLRKT